MLGELAKQNNHGFCNAVVSTRLGKLCLELGGEILQNLFSFLVDDGYTGLNQPNQHQ
jgi:hypothetical protein